MQSFPSHSEGAIVSTAVAIAIASSSASARIVTAAGWRIG